jgi:hypothetical protein
VRQDHAAVHRGNSRERCQEGALGGAEDLLRPAQAASRELDAAAVREDPERDQIVVAGDAGGGKLGHRRNALVRMRTVTDQIASDEIPVDTVAVQSAQDGAQRVEVAVHIGDDSVAHAASGPRPAG